MSQLNNETEALDLYKSVRNNSRVILYTDLIGRRDEDGNREEAHRDDLWAISTEELDKFMALIANHDREVRLNELELMRNPNHAHSKSYYEKRKAELEGSNAHLS